MATFKAVVKRARADGFYPVYIRVTHNRKLGYIKTDKMITRHELSRTGEIEDPVVMNYCVQCILDYNTRLNTRDIKHWTVREVVDFLSRGDDDICFSDFARMHIARMIDTGHQRNARNYSLALGHMERFAGTNKVMFSHVTSVFLNAWIKSLGQSHRAKEMYPVCMRQVFKAAQVEFNDYDTGLLRIKSNPWVRVPIPKADKAEKLAITPEACREFFSFPLPETRMRYPLPELGRDVAMMILCLGGINTVDLYQLKRVNFTDGIIRYNRAKTKRFRADEAYMEMRVPPILTPIVEKYLNRDENDGHLFNFYQRMSNSDSFNANVNIGIKAICKAMGLPKEQWYSAYTFRHTWGTVAQNDVRATIAEVAFAMNHASEHRVTRGYIKIDYSPAWELNEKVVEFIFFTDKASVRERKPEEQHFKLSFRHMVQGTAYFQGRKVAEVTDIGFNNVDDVIARLVTMLPEDIPLRSMVLFKIVNMDKDQTSVYQRQKGKGF